MANTYTPIQTSTLGSNGTFTFSGISGSYTDLIIVGSNILNTNSGISVWLQLNGDTSTSSYASLYMFSNGTTATSGPLTGRAGAYISWYACPNTSGDTSSFECIIKNYANANIYKTIKSQFVVPSGTSSGPEQVISTYSGSTNAITSIKVAPDTGSFLTGTTMTLFGITAA